MSLVSISFKIVNNVVKVTGYKKNAWTHRHGHTGPNALPRPLKWSENYLSLLKKLETEDMLPQ